MLQFMEDVLLHTKTKDTNRGIVEKIPFPITRWENILGAPRLVDKEELASITPSEYAFFTDGELTLSDEEYATCFGN